MAILPEETTRTVLELQRRLLTIIHEATATDFLILDQYGETETTLIDLEQLQNVQERADTYYTRFYRLLRQIAESQPLANPAILELLDRSMEEAEATINALEASILEIKRDWNIL
ncbi:MAG: hypothetical protein AB4426_34070 [Xenococcaceae cyanobacterium]